MGSLKSTVTFALTLPGLNKQSIDRHESYWRIDRPTKNLKKEGKFYLPEAVYNNTNIEWIIAISFVKLKKKKILKYMKADVITVIIIGK